MPCGSSGAGQATPGFGHASLVQTKLGEVRRDVLGILSLGWTAEEDEREQGGRERERCMCD